MTTGVFDLLHPGHLAMLQEARKLGDELVVVLARDESAAREKHRPIQHEEQRRQMVEALKPVDRAVLGHLGDYYRIVEELRPDVIALGYDDYHKVEELKQRLAERGLQPDIVRITKFHHDLDGTRKIIRRIFDSGLFTPPSAPEPPKPGQEGKPLEAYGSAPPKEAPR
jgi:FAD synthetase